jgi:hypothetical protein
MWLASWIGAGESCGTTGKILGFLGSLRSLGMTSYWRDMFHRNDALLANAVSVDSPWGV